MANNYTLFSFAVALETDEQKAWAQRAIDFIEEHMEDEDRVVDPDIGDVLPEDDYCGFVAEVDDDGLWIHVDESGIPEHVVPLLQGYLRRFKPTGNVSFEWADVCSKPQLDEFGGGACFVTVDNAEWMHTGTWVHEQVKRTTVTAQNLANPPVIPEPTSDTKKTVNVTLEAEGAWEVWEVEVPEDATEAWIRDNWDDEANSRQLGDSGATSYTVTTVEDA